MYKRHRYLLAVLTFSIAAIAYYLEIDFYTISSEMINLVSIALAIYSIVLGALCGDSELAKKMRRTVDGTFKDRTQQGVLNSYISQALSLGIATIILAVVVLVLHDERRLTHLYVLSEAKEVINLKPIYQIISAIGTALSFSNFFYIAVITKFIMRRLVWNK